jgi:hypothetical protein
MALDPRYYNLGARAALDALMVKLNVLNAHNGVIKIFSGAAPITCETADSGTLLSTLGLSATAFAASTDNSDGTGKATANAITSDTNAIGTGTAGYFRAYSYDGTTYTCIIQGTVGTATTDMILNTVSIVAASTVAISAWTVQMPDGSTTD